MKTNPNELTAEIIPDSDQKINENRMKQLQQIARDRIFEPFEGKKALEKIQKTRSGLEKGVEHIKTATTKAKSAGVNAGSWLKNSRLFQSSKGKLQQLIYSEEDASSDGVFSKFSQKMSKRVSDLKEAFELLDEATEGFQESTKKTYKELEHKVKETSIEYTRKGLEVLLYEDTEKWLIPKAVELLQRQDLSSFEDIQKLSPEERTILIEQLYPYNSPTFQKYLKAFDVTLNVSLGAVVASNLPGTGLLVSFINIGKTLIKLGNRINIMSAVYGRKIQSPQSLFKVCTKILQSLEDWENNPDHLPLNPDILEDLFQPADETEDFFQEMMATVIKKEAYIAVPGVGMISLGKINLDDLKMDLLVRHLVENYFTQQEIFKIPEVGSVKLMLEDFTNIYSELKANHILKAFIQRVETEQVEFDKKRFSSRLKQMAGIDLALEKAHYEFDMLAKTIYIKIQALPPADKIQKIKEEVERLSSGQLIQR